MAMEEDETPRASSKKKTEGIEVDALEKNQTNQRVFDYVATRQRQRREEDEGNIDDQAARGEITDQERQKLMARRSMRASNQADEGFNENVAAAGLETTEMMLGSFLETKKKTHRLTYFRKLIRVEWIHELVDDEWARRNSRDFVHPLPRLHRFVSSPGFELAMAVLMAASALLLGFEVSAPVDMDPAKMTLYKQMENLFTVLLCIEIFLRILCDGWVWIFNRTNVFDMLLVFGTILPLWVLQPAGVQGGIVRSLAVFRVFRLVRLIRTVRLFPVFRTLWYLVEGVLGSINVFMFAWLLMGSTIYMLGIWSVYAVGKADGLKDDALAQSCFGNVANAMFMLFQTMTLDDWSSAMRKLKPHSPLVVPVFLFSIMVLTMLLANLVTSVVIRNTTGLTTQDTDMAMQWKIQARERNYAELRELLLEMDEDGNGLLSLDEYEDALKNKENVQAKFAALGISEEEQREVWEFVSFKDEDVLIDDFCAMLKAIRGEAKGKDLFSILRRVEKANLAVTKLKARMTSDQAFIELLQAECTEVRKQFGSLQDELAGFVAQLGDCVPKGRISCDKSGLQELDRRVEKKMEYLQ